MTKYTQLQQVSIIQKVEGEESKMTKAKTTEGICPDCNAHLVLGEGIVEGDTFSRGARCPQCGFEGEQIYNLIFSEIIRQ